MNGSSARLDAGQHEAQRNQFRFAEHFHEPANRAALDDRANEAAENEQRNDRHGGLGFIHGDAEIEIVADEQRQGGFKASEGKRREEKNQDEQADFRLRQRVSPLRETRARFATCSEPGLRLSARME